MNSFLSFFSFYGRTNRLAWWGRQLLIIAWWIVFIVVFTVMFGDPAEGAAELDVASANTKLLYLAGAMVVSMWLNFSSMVRRYHDRGKSGLWCLLLLLPIVGPLWQVVELGFFSGQSGDNQYGERPGGRRVDAFGEAFAEVGIQSAPVSAPAPSSPVRTKKNTHANQGRSTGLAGPGRASFGVRGT